MKIRWFYPLLVTLILIGCSAKTETKEKLNLIASPKFEMSTVNDLGESITSTFIGKKGHLAIIDSPLSVNQPQKVMWLLWGNENELISKPFKVVATHEDGKEVTVVETELMGSNWGATAHTPSLVNLPTKGLWKMDVYVDEKKFGDVTVNVPENLDEQS